MEKIDFKGWSNCYRLSNNLVDLIITADVGPRIIRYGFNGEDNEFKEYADMVGKTGGEEWLLYGGHRLWHSPEGKPRSYFPDNFPVEIEQISNGLRVIQPTETTTGIQKEIDITLSGKDSHVIVRHRLRNNNLWAVDLAPWALTVMAPGGKCIIPLPPRGSHEGELLATSLMAIWAYTDFSDPRWTLSRKYVMLRQDPAMGPQKIGLMDTDGWLAYSRNNHLFVKKFKYIQGATYPDFGCSVETFTNEDMLEVETVAPLARLEPQQMVEHVEHWFLFKDVPTPKNDNDVDSHVLPKVESASVNSITGRS